jgi:chaperonin GroEL
MIHTESIYGDESLKHLIAGVDKVANAVKVTLGPKGRLVAVYANGTQQPRLTKDGVTVANSIFSDNSAEAVGVSLAKQAGRKAVEKSGDGTTTATILTQALLHNAVAKMKEGVHPVFLKKEIDEEVVKVTDYLKSISRQIEPNDFASLLNVATISANNDPELGKLVAEAVHAIGVDGMVEVEHGGGKKVSLELFDGVKLDGGYYDPAFVNNPSKANYEAKEVKILVLEGRASNWTPAVSAILEKCFREAIPIVVFAKDFGGEFFQSCKLNRAQVALNVCLVSVGAHNEYQRMFLEDVCAITGARHYSDEKGDGLKAVKWDDLGSCKKIVVNKNNTYIIEGGGDKDAFALKKASYEARLDELKETGTDATELEFYRQRVARLGGKAAKLTIGSYSESAGHEIRDRIDDAINATQAAMSDGIIPGGGLPLYFFSHANVDSQSIGTEVVNKAIRKPYEQMFENTAQRVEYFETPYIGVNLATGEKCNFMDAGIVDPVKVTIEALEAAASVVGMIISTDCIIYNTAT